MLTLRQLHAHSSQLHADTEVGLGLSYFLSRKRKTPVALLQTARQGWRWGNAGPGERAIEAPSSTVPDQSDRTDSNTENLKLNSENLILKISYQMRGAPRRGRDGPLTGAFRHSRPGMASPSEPLRGPSPRPLSEAPLRGPSLSVLRVAVQCVHASVGPVCPGSGGLLSISSLVNEQLNKQPLPISHFARAAQIQGGLRVTRSPLVIPCYPRRRP
jgi:hypothetical protein